jgi:hypothetical protein
MIVGTDNDAVYRSEFVQSLNASLGISSQQGPQYSPTFINRVERAGRTLNDRLRAIGATKEDWDLYAPYLNFTEGMRPKEERGGRTPFELLFNRRVLAPFDAASLALIMKETGENPEDFGSISFEELVQRVDNDHFWARSVQEVRRDLAAERFNREHATKDVPLKVGDLVAVRASPRKETVKAIAKLDRPFYGPCRVTLLSDGGMIATMEWVPDPAIRLVRHLTDLKRYHVSDDEIYDGLNVDRYVVEEIIDARGDTENREYLCRWRGFPLEFDSWVERSDVLDKKLRDEADLKWIPTDQARIADERARRPKAKAPQEMLVQISVDDILSVEGLKASRHSEEPSIQLAVRQRNGKPAIRYYRLSTLPPDVVQMPEVQKLLTEHMG